MRQPQPSMKPEEDKDKVFQVYRILNLPIEVLKA